MKIRNKKAFSYGKIQIRALLPRNELVTSTIALGATDRVKKLTKKDYNVSHIYTSFEFFQLIGRYIISILK